MCIMMVFNCTFSHCVLQEPQIHMKDFILLKIYIFLLNYVYAIKLFLNIDFLNLKLICFSLTFLVQFGL